MQASLNPCWGGIWSWRLYEVKIDQQTGRVLILVWVEYGLGDEYASVSVNDHFYKS